MPSSKRRAVVLHGSLNPAGGGEKVALETICLLKDMGFQVDLVAGEPTDWRHVESILQPRCKPDREYSLPFRLGRFKLYARILKLIPAIPRLRGASLVVNTHGDVLPYPADIVYMHFPSAFLTKTMNPSMEKYRRSLLWKLYALPYELVEKLLLRRVEKSLVLTNSRFSRRKIREILGIDARVVYPPVDVDLFSRASRRRNREDIVVSCGRYNPSKRFDLLLGTAGELPGVEFHVVGTVKGAFSQAYYEKLLRVKEEKRLSNVFLHVNMSREEQLDLYSRAKVYVHPMMYEHFGIAVVEAMASGLVPVVHMSGGPYEDIIDRGKYGLFFNSKDSLPGAVRLALRYYEDYSRLAQGRARRFSRKRFRREMEKIVGEVLAGKRRR